jgi:plastocyanin
MKLFVCPAMILATVLVSSVARTAAPVGEAGTGSVEGVVTFQGEVPRSRIPDDAGVRHDLLYVDRESRGLRYVAVWLAADRTTLTNRLTEEPLKPALMDQLDHQFVPRVLAVRAGQPVKFTNSDPANHNVRTASSQPTNEFNVFTGIDGSYTHRFVAVPQQSPVRLGCDIHPWMRGWIYVFDHPHFAVTDEQGRFRINSVPPGRYKLLLRQPDIRFIAEREVAVAPGEVARVAVEASAPKPDGSTGD